MTAIVLDGEAVAAEIKADLAERIARLTAQGVTPGWARCWWATTGRAPTTWP